MRLMCLLKYLLIFICGLHFKSIILCVYFSDLRYFPSPYTASNLPNDYNVPVPGPPLDSSCCLPLIGGSKILDIYLFILFLFLFGNFKCTEKLQVKYKYIVFP